MLQTGILRKKLKHIETKWNNLKRNEIKKTQINQNEIKWKNKILSYL